MKKCVVSHSYLSIYTGASLFLATGIVIVSYLFRGGPTPWEFYVASSMGLICLFYQTISFAGGLFYMGDEGVGMRLFLFKKRIIPWNEIEDYGVFQVANINIIYFSSRHLPWNMQTNFLAKTKVREMDWLAFAELDCYFIKTYSDNIPPQYASFIRERARQNGLKIPGNTDW